MECCREGVAAHVTGGSSTDEREWGGVGTTRALEKANVQGRKTPVSGTLEASRAVWPGLWGQILQSLLLLRD